MMLNPRKSKYVDRLRLLIAVVFGAALGFTNGYSHGWFNALWALVGAVVVGGAFYCYRAFRQRARVWRSVTFFGVEPDR
jgi:lipoprotein signal peptidase